MYSGKDNARVLDVGTGSGAIAIAIAVDPPSAALNYHGGYFCRRYRSSVAQRAASPGQDRVTIRRSDCFQMLDGGAALGTFDAVVSNPPYLGDAEIASLEPEVRSFEPRIALSAGTTGFDVVQRITRGARERLESNGG